MGRRGGPGGTAPRHGPGAEDGEEGYPVEDGDEVVLYEIGRRAAGDAPARPVRRPRPPVLVVIAETPGWTAVLKPAGLASVRERWDHDAPTAVSLLHDLWRARDPEAPLPFVIHRIDRATSGLLLFGRTREAARALSEAFRHRTVDKEYLALVDGSPPEPAGEVELRLAPDPARPGAMRVERKGGKRSVTAWEIAESFRGHTLVRFLPRTGRTHQIRVTAAHLGCPVVADPIYGDGRGLLLSSFKRRYVKPRDHAEFPLLGRLALHAHRLRFPDPEAAPPAPGEAAPRAAVEAPLPKDFRVALEKLRRWGAVRRREPLPGESAPEGEARGFEGEGEARGVEGGL